MTTETTFDHKYCQDTDLSMSFAFYVYTLSRCAMAFFLSLQNLNTKFK